MLHSKGDLVKFRSQNKGENLSNTEVLLNDFELNCIIFITLHFD